MKIAAIWRVLLMKKKRAGIFTIAVVFILIVYASVTLIHLSSKIKDVYSEQDTLKQEITDKEVSNAELEYAIEHSDDDETIADIARDKLGLADPDEQVYYDAGN